GATRALASIFPGARIDVESLYASSERVLSARHKTYEAYQRITLTSVPATKMTVYGDLLRAMLTDQLAFIAEPSHTRVITEDNGRESLRMSGRAAQLAMSESYGARASSPLSRRRRQLRSTPRLRAHSSHAWFQNICQLRDSGGEGAQQCPEIRDLCGMRPHSVDSRWQSVRKDESTRSE